MAFMMCVCFTSCRNDAEIPDHGPVMHPETETAGVYTGQWTRVNTSTEAAETLDGTITLSATDQAYISTMQAKCDGINLDVTKNINITPGGQGYMFSNVLGLDLPGADKAAPFYGNVSKQGEIDIFFQATFREGRKTVTYRYTFVGKK